MTKCTIPTDVACVMDGHVVAKHQEKTEKYLDQAIETSGIVEHKN